MQEYNKNREEKITMMMGCAKDYPLILAYSIDLSTLLHEAVKKLKSLGVLTEYTFNITKHSEASIISSMIEQIEKEEGFETK